MELGHLGTGAARAIPNLEGLLIDDEEDVRTAAALAMARVGGHSAKMVGPLLELLQRPNDHEKYLAVKALGLLGTDAYEAIPLLQRELEIGHQEVKKVLRDALEKIDKRCNKY